MASAAVISSSHPLTAESSRSAQQAMDQDDENDLLAIQITAPGDVTELERDYADDLEDLVALSVAQHLGPKRSRLSRLHLQPSSATGLPKSPSLYASPRIPLRSSVSVSASQQGWETLQAGTTPPVSKEPLSIEETAVGAAVLLPRPSRALEEVQRRLVSERSTRIPEKRKTATAEQRSVSQPPAARVRPPAARDDSSQIPPTSSRARLATATDLPSRLPTPRRRVPSQGPSRSFSPRTGTGEDPITPAGATTELELEEIVFIETTKTPASSSGRAGPSSHEDPAAATATAARRNPARPATARVSTSRRTVSTSSRMRTKSAPWPTTSGGGESKSDEPLPPWFDDSGPRIYRSSEGELIFARATDPGPASPSSSSATASTTASLPLHYHRPQDRVLPAVAKRIEAERLKQLQADDDPGLGNSRLRESSSTPPTKTTSAAAELSGLSFVAVAAPNFRPTEAVAAQPDLPGPPGGDLAAECTTTSSSSPHSPPLAPSLRESVGGRRLSLPLPSRVPIPSTAA
ncbi:hypothetical protein RHOSPDRAFT_32858 [Rhodotorula sp. JG-1b]|nr:hypothetical protein RHOSPDRAFT_32858 [Rhodotorula sp. JG-1b]